MYFFEFLIDMVGHTVARFALPLLSFGKIYVQPLNAPFGKFNAFGYRYDEDGRVEVDSTVSGWIGFVVCLILFIAIGLLIHAVV
jgi:hypothetical protein